MSDNKIYDDLEFDDDIDFDGLDETEDEKSDVSDNEASVYISEEIPAIPQFAEDLTVSAETESDEYSAETIADSYGCVSTEIDEKSVYTPLIGISEQSQQVSAEKTAGKSEKFLRCICAVNAAISVVTLSVLALGVYFGYKYINGIKTDLEAKNAEVAELEDKNSELEAEYLEAMNMFEKESEKDNDIQANETEQGKIVHYDTYVGYSWMPVLTGIKQNTYINENFSVDDRYRMSYTVDGEESSYFGIDVSSYQGEIDWQLVKEDGVEFAFLRVGYRGYGEEGKLCADEYFLKNYEAARDAGIDLGIYFFSQAATVDEAVEEAEFVLSLLENRQLEYPIVFDWETVVTGDPEDIPRTEDVMPQTLTLSAIAFCETVKDAGYDAMIYTNKKLATIKYDLRQLSEYPVWLAYYDTELNYCYDFDIWQYGTGQVDGIEGEVDVNIAIIK